METEKTYCNIYILNYFMERIDGGIRRFAVARGVLLAAVGVMLLVGAGRCGADMQVQGYSPSVNDRFNNSTSFLGEGYNFSGVGNSSGAAGTGVWGTMISPQYFVSASHAYPGPGTALTFYSTNNANGPSYTGIVASGTPIIDAAGNYTDLWLGELTAPIPASADIAYYPIAYSASGNYDGLGIYVYGVPNRLGYNHIAATAMQPLGVQNGTEISESLYSDGFDPLPGGLEEAYLQPGDSGGPEFAVVDGALALVGTNSFINGYESGAVLVPYYLPQIQALMNLTDAQAAIAAVPEPGSVWILGVGLGLFLMPRRRVA
jgi:hypothetical protein